MKKRVYALLLVFCMLAGIVGCGKPQREAPSGPQGHSGEPETEKGDADDESTVSYDGEEMELLRNGVNTFAYNLYERLDGEENVFFSPYSLCSALSLLNLGAGTETKEELDILLGIMDAEAWNSAMRAYLETQWQDDTFVLTANSIWMREEKEWAEGIEADFLNPAKDFYHSGLYEADFAKDPEGALERINGWASDNTQGMIPQVLNGLPVDTAMILMNAVYFEGKWEEPFMEEDTYEQIFAGTAGEKEVEMMHQYNKYYAYIEADAIAGCGIKGIALPYEDSPLVMKIFIPDGRGDIVSLFDALSIEEKEALLDSLDSAASEKITRLAIPKFAMEQEIKGLNALLQEMGMKTAFDMENADFGKIAEDLYVSQVLHKAKIEVDEQGTRASAVTTIVTNDGCAPMEEEPIVFEANQPFIYVIQDTRTGMILFMGRVNNLE